MHPMFKDANKRFIVTLFIEEDDYRAHQKDFETWGNQKNIKLVVQPCPFEAVEFLYRIDFDIKGHANSFEKTYFWQALTLPRSISDAQVEKIAGIHHAYLVSIIENETKHVKAYAKELQSLL
ncbi:MAG: hypothetical protein R3A45_09395 [Bdellovibrionota bacterium]